MKKKRKKSHITGWTLKIWWGNKNVGLPETEEYVDTTDMPDDIAQGIDDYLYEKYERSNKCTGS